MRVEMYVHYVTHSLAIIKTHVDEMPFPEKGSFLLGPEIMMPRPMWVARDGEWNEAESEDHFYREIEAEVWRCRACTSPKIWLGNFRAELGEILSKKGQTRVRVTQEKLAFLLCTSASAVQKWESSKEREPPAFLWRALRDLSREMSDMDRERCADLLNDLA